MQVIFKTEKHFTVERQGEVLLEAVFQLDNRTLDLHCSVTEKNQTRELDFELASNRFFALTAKYDLYENRRPIGKLAFKWNGNGKIDFFEPSKP